MKLNLIIPISFLVVFVSFFSFLGINLYLNQNSLQKDLIKNMEEVKDLKHPVKEVIEKIYSKNQPWADLQKKVRTTVVQIFSQRVEMDWLEPYKTPAQSQSCGSGFFINDEGEIATNAHNVMQIQSVWIQIPYLGQKIIDL